MLSILTSKIFYERFIAGLLVAGALLCIFPPDLLIFKEGANFAVPILFVYFLLAHIFLLFRSQYLMYVSFICCIGFGLFLRNSFGKEGVQRFVFAKPNQEPSLKVAHFNTSTANEDYETFMEAILKTDAELLSVQEVTPDWAMLLRENLNQHYPYSKTILRIDFFGSAIYSKHPFSRLDTFHFEEIPNIVGSIKIDSIGEEIFFITSQTTPPVSSSAYQKISKHLEQIAYHTASVKQPIFVLGDYNVVPWSSEIQQFRQVSKLSDGRNNFLPSRPRPLDYILFSNHFDCTAFTPISGKDDYLGILGTYQFKYNYRNAKHKKTYQ